MKRKFVLITAIAICSVLIVLSFVACTQFAADAPLGISQDTRKFKKISDDRMFAEAENYGGYIFKTETDAMCFRLKKPNEPKENEKYPLIVFLHGSGDWGTDSSRHMYRSLIDNADKYAGDNSYVFMPQGRNDRDWTDGYGWSDTLGMSDLYNACLDEIIETYPNIDKDRVYITGMSMGGNGTMFQLYNYPDKYAAAIALCGYYDDEMFSDLRIIKDKPIWLAHSKTDDVAEFQQSMHLYNRLISLGSTNVKTTWIEEYKHDITLPIYQDSEVWEWLLAQRR